MQALMKKSTHDEHVRELMVGANQYGIDVEWARSFQTETKEVGFGDMISSIKETRIVFDTVKCVTFVTN